MKKSRYTEEQIAYALRQAETGTPVAEVIRRMGISEQTYYRWKKVYGGLGVGELRRVKQLEDENRSSSSSRTSVWTSTSCRRFCQKSSDAWAAARSGRARPGGPWRQRTARLHAPRRRPLVDPLRVTPARSDATDAAYP